MLFTSENIDNGLRQTLTIGDTNPSELVVIIDDNRGASVTYYMSMDDAMKLRQELNKLFA